MSNPKEVYRSLEEINKDAVVAEGFEEAYIGYVRRANKPTIAVYDYETCVEILMEQESWTREKAVNFMETGVVATWLGNSTPSFFFPVEGGGNDD
jgi:hypothetical protein|tara:strand:- start:3777 stop:4061 length:285 start_codon:yes stop_codon:yes gene_type:complete